MPNILIRDVDVAVLERLKRRAKYQNRSLQAELNLILRKESERSEPLSALEIARKIKASLPKRPQTDSAELLREDRAR